MYTFLAGLVFCFFAAGKLRWNGDEGRMKGVFGVEQDVMERSVVFGRRRLAKS